METQSTPGQAERTRGRERGGRVARRELRSHGSEGLGRPYIVRNIPTYDILSEENLLRIEETADRILAEIGIEFRDDPVALDHWKRAGAKVDGVLVKFEPGMLREILKTAPAEFTQHARNPAQFRARSAARASCSRRPTARPSSWISTRAAATARSRISAIS